MNTEYKIDYDLFSTEEVVKIISFFQLVEKTKSKKISPQLLKDKYIEYRQILNNKSLEKQYDNMLFKKTNISIYRLMTTLE